VQRRINSQAAGRQASASWWKKSLSEQVKTFSALPARSACSFQRSGSLQVFVCRTLPGSRP
jgi:hypothetical protein